MLYFMQAFLVLLLEGKSKSGVPLVSAAGILEKGSLVPEKGHLF